MIGLYRSGSSFLHRLPAGAKVCALLALLSATLLTGRPWMLAVLAALVAGLYALARIPVRSVWEQLRPLRWFLPVLVIAQGWLVGWNSAVLVAGGLLVSVAAAALLTLTTRISALLDPVEQHPWPWLVRPRTSAVRSFSAWRKDSARVARTG